MPDEEKVLVDEQSDEQSTMGRRDFLKKAAIVGAGTAGALALGGSLAACTSGGSTAATAATGQITESVLDRVIKSGTLRAGYDDTGPPINGRNASTGQPEGYDVDLTTQLAADMGVKLEWVAQTFANLIPGLLAGKYDLVGMPITSSPKRSLQVLFTDIPAFTEDSVLITKAALKPTSLDQMNDPQYTFSNQIGSAQDISARLLFPKATFTPLEMPACILAVISGRSDALLISAYQGAAYLVSNPGTMNVFPAVVMKDPNNYLVPMGDYKTKEFISSWMRYYTAHAFTTASFSKWMSTIPGWDEMQKLIGAAGAQAGG